jgi:3-phosphoshikimate 1-carboxyvinyltransferase
VSVHGSVGPPGDKSITHRALIVASLIRGASHLSRVLTSADARSTASCLRALGTTVSPLRHDAVVTVRGSGWGPPVGSLGCGNSGTTARLLLGALAGHPLTAQLTGDRSLRRRPMRRVTEPLTAMGATFDPEEGAHLPLRVRGGALRPLDWTMPVATAQVKSALILAGLTAGVAVTVREPVRSRDHTERLLAALGAPLRQEGSTVRLSAAPGWLETARPFDWSVPGDPSSAAFLVAAALLARSGELRITGVGLNPTRIGYLRVLARMGGRVAREAEDIVCGEPVGDLVVGPTTLRGTIVSATEIPSLIDEVPVLAVLASRAEGETVFHEVGELRVKESDRLGLLARNLQAIGAQASVDGESLHVVGADRPPRGKVDTASDHRLAMAFAVLGTLPGARVELSERRSVGVSYPTFFADLERVTGRAV